MNLTPEQERELEYGYKIPMGYAAPCYFGNANIPDAKINNGTASLVSYHGDNCAITNQHVIQAYKERSVSEDLQFYIGNKTFVLEDILISECPDYDLAVMYLGDVEAAEIGCLGNVPTAFIDLHDLEEPDLNENDFILFGGYPGGYRNRRGLSVSFGTFSSGSSQVQTVSRDIVTASLNIDQCIKYGNEDILDDLGGISGGPALYQKTLASGIVIHKFLGVVYQYSSSLDSLLIRPSNILRGLI